MSSFRLFAVLLTLVGLTTAIKCYLGIPDAQGKVQNTTECAEKYCVILHPKPGIPVPAMHRCDIYNECKKDGCIEEDQGDVTPRLFSPSSCFEIPIRTHTPMVRLKKSKHAPLCRKIRKKISNLIVSGI
ncbi:hypothetical protein RB195_009168 [Necator americanus]|uniref:Uncharacterized protein n=1 Tax=Necator americanus TaxID=51031 RepID=A0ABR1CTH6_NECAM